jgi:fructose-1,6-bisphosphatase/inositol monophosphatase family enzyme
MWLRSLQKAARAGRAAILANYREKGRYTVTGRGVGGDMTLRIDKASEDAIYRSLRKDFGKDSFVFLSEEVGEMPSTKDPKPIVICDPLDGSHNAQIGLPLFAVSISVLDLNKKIEAGKPRRFKDIDVGVIQSVKTADEFSAVKNNGSRHNGGKIPFGSTHEGDGRIKTLEIECGDVDYYKQIAARLTSKEVYKTRVLGSAALAFSFLANGTSDGFIFAQPGGARTIDSPAGYLIAKEAGRPMTNLAGTMESLEEVEVGFHSRLNMIGASNQTFLSRILNLVRGPDS